MKRNSVLKTILSGLGIFLIFMLGFDIIPLGFGLIILLLELIPILIPIVIFIAIFKGLSKKNGGESTAYTSSNSQTKTNRNPYSANYVNSTPNNRTKNFVSVKDRQLIDDALMEYYSKNYSLPIFEDIHLVTKNGKYAAFEELYISKGGEIIISLEEFGDSFPGTYAEIVSLLKEFAKQKPEVLAAEVEKPEIKKVDKLSDAQKYIERINELNDQVEQAEITNGLYQTCSLLKQIDTATKMYDKVPKIDKLYDYYLPILVKILENYKKLSMTATNSKDFKDTESQLIKTIILINEALKNINETIHEDEYMNLSADITTLQSLLKKDGLVKEGSIYEGDHND